MLNGAKPGLGSHMGVKRPSAKRQGVKVRVYKTERKKTGRKKAECTKPGVKVRVYKTGRKKTGGKNKRRIPKQADLL